MLKELLRANRAPIRSGGHEEPNGDLGMKQTQLKNCDTRCGWPDTNHREPSLDVWGGDLSLSVTGS